MSASLVGSEMCIRDSSSRAHGRHGVGAPPMPMTGLGQSCTQATLSPPSVSYTHLTLPTICSV
eukprot:386989-Alexandrium_andersonii.AAC.1